MFSVGKLCYEPCIWCMCDRVEAYNVCNLLCDGILFTPSSPAQTVLVLGIESTCNIVCCDLLGILSAFIVHQWLPITVDMRMVGFLCTNIVGMV